MRALIPYAGKDRSVRDRWLLQEQRLERVAYLFGIGRRTDQIAELLRLPEADVANHLARVREAETQRP
jgi:hypothetical protein